MTHSSIRSLLALLLLVSTWGCDDENEITPEEAAAYVETWSATVEEDINNRAAGATVKKEIEEILKASVDAEAAADSKKPTYAKFAFDVYSEREFAPKLVQRGKLSATGTVVWDALQRIPDHGLDPKPYALGEIKENLEELGTLAQEVPDEDFNPTAEEKLAVTEWLTGQSKLDIPLDDTSYSKLTDQLLTNSPRLTTALDALNELAAKVGSKSARTEAIMAVDLARLSRTVAHADTRQVFLHPRPDDVHYELGTSNKRTDEEWGALIGDHIWRQSRRLGERMTNKVEFLGRKTREGMKELFAAKEPKTVIAKHINAPHPQYPKMVNAMKKYRTIVDAGGWKEVAQEKRLKKGSKTDTVKALKERLKVEGFLPADLTVDNTFDDKLETAIKDYQETHQLEVTGTPTKSFWKSLNVPATKRMNQIKINLERLRRTAVRHSEDDIYVYINIPDFNAEVWEKQKREMRFRVVVGNNDRVKNEETEEWERSNRTPVPLTAMIDRVIYNPYWVVTPRIRTNEILKDVKKDVEAKYAAFREKKIKEGVDPSTLVFPYLNKETGEVDVSTTIPGKTPSWYAANGYEVVAPGKSWEYVRMLPGPGNALGKVKVIFPNLHDVYLHDTNARALFKNPVRAYSHGCMRMQDPLDFAEYLLRRDKLYESNDVEALLKKKEPSPIFLKRKVPVFIEYHTARVDDQERVHFLADPYDYDDKPLDALLTSGK